MATNNNTPRRVQRTDGKVSRRDINELGGRLARTQRDAGKMIIGKPGEPIAEPVRGRPAWIEDCGDGASGGSYGVIKFATGRLDSLVAGNESAKCWINTWFQKETFVIVAPVETSLGEVEWVAMQTLKGPDFYEPATSGLASVQDEPAVKVSCNGSVSAP